MKTNIFICILIFIQANMVVGQSIVNKYANFSPERQLVVEKMGDFFDKTIRENFPGKTDTSSYKDFFHCIFINDTFPESQYILQIDRKKLAEINVDLFKDENYYFFYAKYLLIPAVMKDYMEIEHDSVPTETRYIDNFSRRTNMMGWWNHIPHNHNGYFQRVMAKHIENPSIRNIDTYVKVSGSMDISIFMYHKFDVREMSNPVIKQLAAVLFWRYICFCGGVDMVRRNGFNNRDY
jgi:hypothetical protein